MKKYLERINQELKKLNSKQNNTLIEFIDKLKSFYDRKVLNDLKKLLMILVMIKRV